MVAAKSPRGTKSRGRVTSLAPENRNHVSPEPDDRPHYLYRILMPDGRGYIGVSVDPDTRFSGHKAPSARSLIGEAIRRHSQHNCQPKFLCVGPREYIYALERRAIIAFNTRYPAGYNLDAGGLIPEHHPISIAKNVEANARVLQRKRARFREEFGVSNAQSINYRRLQSRRPRKRPMAADLPDLDNRTARESDPSRPWQILSRRYIAPNRTWASLATPTVAAEMIISARGSEPGNVR